METLIIIYFIGVVASLIIAFWMNLNNGSPPSKLVACCFLSWLIILFYLIINSQQDAEESDFSALRLIDDERHRQKAKENWSELHDDDHWDGELAVAAACYAANKTDAKVVDSEGDDAWPWDSKDDKRNKHDRMKQLTIAGALIVAEMERIERKNKKFEVYS